MMGKLSERMAWAIENCVDSWSELEEEAIKKGIERLAAYEDTGLTPEAVKYMNENAETALLIWFESKYGFPVGELMGMCEAKQRGRMVILPCKLGADIFRLGMKEVCGYWKVAYAEVYPDEVVMIDDSDNSFTADDIGKTVFLSREEAEKVLRKGYISEDIQRQKYISEDIEKDGEG